MFLHISDLLDGEIIAGHGVLPSQIMLGARKKRSQNEGLDGVISPPD
jgi:hypothetical protein